MKFNHHNKRNKIINKCLASDKCFQCLEKESWGHIVQCNTLSKDKRIFIKLICNKLIKERKDNTNEQDILAMLNNIMQYLRGYNEKYKMIQ